MLPASLSRRQFLRRGGALVAAGMMPVLARAAGSPQAPRRLFRFLVVNDLHHASAECDAFLAALVTQMRGHGRVAFCLIVGDLADKGKPESLGAVRDAFRKLRAPIHTVPGNHDCDEEENTDLYSRYFPGQLNRSFTHRGWQFVGLDSTEGNKWGGTNIQPATLAWLDEHLPRLDRTRPTVVFTHFPLMFDVNPRLTPRNAHAVLERFDGYNLRAAFSGHYHARTERVLPKGGVVLTNACCARVRDNHDGTIPEGYLLCSALADGTLTREFVRFAPGERSASAEREL